jgi:SAM-dependent MidA family methyltransferase
MTTSILELIQEKSSPLRFKDFMELALYAPNVGYYTNPLPKIGRQADFVTAPSLGSLFANCLAQQLQQIFASLPVTNFIEYGAGLGHLAASLGFLIDFNQYIIIEISPILRQRQQAYIQQHNPAMFKKVIWLDEMPHNFTGIVFANEVLDAFPVHKFYFHNNQLQEFYISLDKQQQLTWQLGAASQELVAAFDLHHYTSELNSLIRPWLKNIANKLTQGVILLCDYGFDRQEYFHPMRNMGTLMAHYQQYASSELLIRPGEQDITAHIDFTTIAEATLETHLELLGYTNLASFLLNCDILKHYKKSQRLDEFNLLTSASEMGELFKIIALGTNANQSLDGFKSFDYSHKL